MRYMTKGSPPQTYYIAGQGGEQDAHPANILSMHSQDVENTYKRLPRPVDCVSLSQLGCCLTSLKCVDISYTRRKKGLEKMGSDFRGPNDFWGAYDCVRLELSRLLLFLAPWDVSHAVSQFLTRLWLWM